MSLDTCASAQPQRFGGLVRWHRLRRGMTQRELADFSTISVRALRDIELGKAVRPRQRTVELIAEGLRLGPAARADLEVAAERWQPGIAEAGEAGPPMALEAIHGRRAEVTRLADDLNSGVRFQLVVGLPGVGKTRLAAEAAGLLERTAGMALLWHAADGSGRRPWLAGGADQPDQVLRSCARALLSPGGPARGQEVGMAALARFVGDRRVLLVMDGVDGHTVNVDRLGELLNACPRLRVLVTADRHDPVAGDLPLVLGPLGLPRPADHGHPAVRTLLERRGRLRPMAPPRTGAEAETVVEVCRLLDGLPAALEAVGSWLDVYDLRTLHRCLTESPESLLRHLRGAYDDPRLVRRLFRAVADLPDPEAEVLAKLCTGDGDTVFVLSDVVRLTGLTLPQAGRIAHTLLTSGMIRPSWTGSAPGFRVLNLIRTVHHAPMESDATRGA